MTPDGFYKLTGEHQDFLSKRFSMEELKSAIGGMAMNKAAGSDGFNAEFYQEN
jgi:hypothetical protein